MIRTTSISFNSEPVVCLPAYERVHRIGPRKGQKVFYRRRYVQALATFHTTHGPVTLEKWVENGKTWYCFRYDEFRHTTGCSSPVDLLRWWGENLLGFC